MTWVSLPARRQVKETFSRASFFTMRSATRSSLNLMWVGTSMRICASSSEKSLGTWR
ncbi:hypothetical protein NKH18_00170 [Streptomyces sp. M10(2022)]